MGDCSMKRYISKKLIVFYISIIALILFSLLFWYFFDLKNREIQTLKLANQAISSKLVLEHAVYTNYVAYSDSISAEKQKAIDSLNIEKVNLGLLVQKTELNKQNLYSSFFCKFYNDIKPIFSYRSNEAVLVELKNRFRMVHPNDEITDSYFKKVFYNSEKAVHTLIIGDAKEDYIVTFDEPDLDNKRSVYVISNSCYLDYPYIDALINPPE
jgi:hypothetical protein